jgi:trigger factor
MRAEVRQSMEQELAEVIHSRLRVQVLDALYKDNPIDVPRALIEEQVQQLQIDTARRLGIRDASRLPPRESFEAAARRRVALGLLIGQIVQAQGLKVDRERVQARLAALAQGYPDPEQARRAYLQNPDAMRQIESAVLEDQVVDWVLERAQVSERRMTFADITGFGRPAYGHDHDHDHDHDHEHGPAIETAAAHEHQHDEASGT